MLVPPCNYYPQKEPGADFIFSPNRGFNNICLTKDQKYNFSPSVLGCDLRVIGWGGT